MAFDYYRTVRLFAVRHIPALDHDFHVFEHRHVFERVAVHGDEVGEVARLKRAYAVRPSEQVRSIDGRGL